MNEILKRTAGIKNTEANEELRLSFIMISRDNACRRFDWESGRYYTEMLDPKGADCLRLKTMFKDHEPSVDNAIARIENIRLEDDELVCDCVFSSDAKSQEIFKKYQDGILSDVSIGYVITEQQKSRKQGGVDEVFVTKFSVVELSAVWLGADKGAKKREQEEQTERQAEISAYQQLQLRKLNLQLKELGL